MLLPTFPGYINAKFKVDAIVNSILWFISYFVNGQMLRSVLIVRASEHSLLLQPFQDLPHLILHSSRLRDIIVESLFTHSETLMGHRVKSKNDKRGRRFSLIDGRLSQIHKEGIFFIFLAYSKKWLTSSSRNWQSLLKLNGIMFYFIFLNILHHTSTNPHTHATLHYEIKSCTSENCI